MIDGSNIIFLLKDHNLASAPQLDCVSDVIEEIMALGIPREKIVAYFDANIKYKLDRSDQNRLNKGIKEGIYRRVPSGTATDTSLVQLGEKLGRKFVVISNDMFNDRPEWFREHRIGVGLSPDDQPYLTIESIEDLLNLLNGFNKHLNKKNGNER